MASNHNAKMANVLTGWFIDGDHKEVIQLEYRYNNEQNFEVFTRIQGQIYHIVDKKFFESIANLLDNFEPSCEIVILHKLLVRFNSEIIISDLEEILSPYKSKNTGTVVYKLRMHLNGELYETRSNTDFGGLSGMSGGVLEELISLLGKNVEIQVCYFCRNLIDYNEYGGTDYRHDQLYCLRDNQDLLNKILVVYPHLLEFEETLSHTDAPNISALHSCSGFTKREYTRP